MGALVRNIAGENIGESIEVIGENLRVMLPARKYARTTDGTPDVKNVATLLVPAGATASTDLQGLQGDPDLQNSFEVVSDQPAGAVLDNVLSRSDTGIRWVELPGKDMENSHNAGNHPWTVTDGTESTLLLFNETAAPENFTVRVASGQTVWTKKYSLAPLATKAIDINQLIEDRVKDDKGNLLPRGLQTGEANWFVGRQYGGTGRLLQSNPASYAARSFSCGEEGVIMGSDWYPDVTSEPVGQTNDLGELDAQVGLTEGGGCYGDYVGDSNDYEYGWGSENNSIATSSGGGLGYSSSSFYGVSVGATYIDGEVFDNYGCSAGISQQVTITPIVQITSADVVNNNVQVALSSGSSGVSGNLTVIVSGANNSPSYTLYNQTVGQGTYSFGFQRAQLPTGEYTQIQATWSLPGLSPVQVNQSITNFDVLGVYHHTQYNSPWESACTGSPLAAVITDSSCNQTNSTLKSDFISQVNLNGSGFSLNWGGVQKEAYCVQHAGAPNNDSFRKNTPPAGSCNGNTGALNNNTVAVDPTGPLECGDQILIINSDGSTNAEKTVTDTCPACTGQAHTDNYTTVQYCSSGEVGDYGTGYYQTIRLR